MSKSNPSDIQKNPGSQPPANDKGSKPSILSGLKKRAEALTAEPMSIDSWLELSRNDKGAYADFADRLRTAIGEPDIIDTKLSDKQERVVFRQKKIARYNTFSDLYDSEGVISKVANYITDGAAGILVLRGPVGSGKTEIATTLEKLIEKEPVYLLKCKETGELSPFNDTPLCLFSEDQETKVAVTKEYGIPERYMDVVASPWVTKRLKHHGFDADAAFEVQKIHPSRLEQRVVAKLDPKDKKSPDINALIGSRDLGREGDEDPLNPEKTMSEGDPDAYTPGVFSKSNGGVLHGAEFFRNDPGMLNTFLEAVTEGYFTGSSGVGMLPMNQLIVLTTNDPVWQEILKAADSDALRDRSVIVDVGYTVRMSEEAKIYEKLLKKNNLQDLDIAPRTLDLLAEFAIVTRLKDGEENALEVYDRHIRAKVLNGEPVDGAEKKVPKIDELYQKQSKDQGLSGFSIRDAERVMKEAFNARTNEGIREADTLLMIETLENFIADADDKTIPSNIREMYTEELNELKDRERKEIEETVNLALIDADEGQCQTLFEKYVHYARSFLSDEVITEGGEEINKSRILKFLGQMETQGKITQPEEFRRTLVAAYDGELARIGRNNMGKTPKEQEDFTVKWDSYEPMAKVIRAHYETDLETKRHILKAKSESDLKTDEEKRQYSQFYNNMHDQGYTDTMVDRMLLELT